MAEDKTAIAGEFEEVPCNVCGSRRFKVLFDHQYGGEMAGGVGYFVATTDDFQDYGRIVKCSDCGLAYTNPRPTQAVLAKGYSDYKDEEYLLESSSRSINAHLSLNTIKRFADKGKLLEIGSSVGYFLNAARLDFDAVGFEPSEWACRIASERFKLEIHNSPFDAARLQPESFDVVAMLDVAEHLTDPKAALKEIAGVLKPGGLLYLVTPDFSGLTAKILRSYWWGLRPSHIYYFTPETLGVILEELGFEIVLKKSFGRMFSLGYWLSRLKNYPAFVRLPVEKFIGAMNMKDKLVYIDTRDTMEICARKKKTGSGPAAGSRK